MYVHCTYSWYNVRTMYVHCTYSARWVRLQSTPEESYILHAMISLLKSMAFADMICRGYTSQVQLYNQPTCRCTCECLGPINHNCYSAYLLTAISTDTDHTRSETFRQRVSLKIKFDECLDVYKLMRTAAWYILVVATTFLLMTRVYHAASD